MNENRQPLLSICIPTYNREKYIKTLIDSIVSQKEFCDYDDVEIVISDNASVDWTRKLITWYITKYWEKIKYYCNEINLWMCKNLLKSQTLWSWKYIWLMWSDQALKKWSLAKMLEWISKTNANAIMINRTPWETRYISFSWLSDFSSVIWLNKSEFLDYEWWFLTFCSFCCLKKTYIDESLEYLKLRFPDIYDDLWSNYFNFSIVRYSMLYGSDSILYIKNADLFLSVPDAKSSWIINKKIVSDLNILINYISDNYNLTNSAKRVLKSVKKIRVTAYLVLPFRKVCETFHITKFYTNLWVLYRKILTKNH